MGCWNGTCAVTNLPIFAGEEVYAIFLANKWYNSGNDRATYCHANDRFTPIGLWFTGEYNDYGALENCCDLLDFNINMFKDYMVEFDGTARLDAIAPEGLNSKNIFSLDHEGQLELNVHNAIRYKNMTHITVKKDVFEEIMKYDPVDYCGEGLQNNIKKAIKDIVADLDKWSKLDPDNKPLFFPDTDYRLREAYCLPKLKVLFLDAYLDGDQKTMDIINEHCVKKQVFDVFMNDGRYSYAPPSGAGSQSDNTEAQKLVANLTLECAKKVETWYDDY